MKLLLFLSRHASAFVILTAIVSFLFPVVFGWVRGNVSSLILGFIMLTMGLTLSTNDFKVLIHRPQDIGIGAVAQFTVMPFLAFGLTKIFGLDPYLAVGIILVGCCPGGVSSNIMSFLCKGDVAYSVGMTTVSTLLAPFMTPFLVWFLADTSINVDAIGMFLNILLVTILPVTLGCLLNYWVGRSENFKTLQSVMPGFSVIGLALIVGGVVSQVQPQLVSNGVALFFLVLAVVFLHNGIGYVLGYNVGRLFKFPLAKKKTLSIEVGMQNAGMATVLASAFFVVEGNPDSVLCVLPCAISCAYHSISGTILAGVFAKWKEESKD
ncbi:MAG: bile acid:sodium symporter family protein [Bacteroidales bacterium]|nr:bile acid:sodium symporter family protein [Bacteroidales bacterium]